MGREARCSALVNGAPEEGKALLETDALIFRGQSRVVIPYREMSDVQAEQGRLTVTWPGGNAVFDLREEAERWAHRIRNPKSLIDKLGIKPGQHVMVLRLHDDAFVAQLHERAERVSVGRAHKDADAIFYGADKAADLAKLAHLKGYLKPNGALWVVRPKGGGAITENDVLAGGKEAGLVDVKVVRFSATHTAEKFVIPVAARR
jgi:hypothetical protein